MLGDRCHGWSSGLYFLQPLGSANHPHIGQTQGPSDCRSPRRVTGILSPSLSQPHNQDPLQMLLSLTSMSSKIGNVQVSEPRHRELCVLDEPAGRFQCRGSLRNILSMVTNQKLLCLHAGILSRATAFLPQQNFYNTNCLWWDQLIKNNGLRLLLLVINSWLLKPSRKHTSLRKNRYSSLLPPAAGRSLVIYLSHQ